MPSIDGKDLKLTFLFNRLYLFMIKKQYENVRFILPAIKAESVDIYYKNNRKMPSPIEFAIDLQDTKLIDVLMQFDGPNLDGGMSMGKHIIHYACKKNCLHSLKQLIETHKFNADVLDNYYRTALHYCAKYGAADVCKYLLNKKVKYVNDKDGNNNAPLHVAFKHNHFGVFRLIAESWDCNVDVTDGNGRSVLLLACMKNKLDLVEWLMDMGADYNLCDLDFVSPLVVSVFNPGLAALMNKIFL